MGRSLLLFEWARGGAIFGVLFGAIIFIGIAISALKQTDEKTVRLQFALGGLVGLIVLGVTDWFALETVRRSLENAGPIV